jgi:hypothetical protein
VPSPAVRASQRDASVDLVIDGGGHDRFGARLFEPLFTTKMIGRARDSVWPRVSAIVTASGGEINARRARQRAVITLPLASAEQLAAGDTGGEWPTASGRASLWTIRTTCSRSCGRSRSRYTVLTADGEAGLAVLAERPWTSL